MDIKQTKLSIFWFRRDLRLEDNAGLYHSLRGPFPVIPLFIFDTNILERLTEKNDRRVEFIHHALAEMQNQLKRQGSSLLILSGKPLEVWKKLEHNYPIAEVYTNHDYEPEAIKRDQEIQTYLEKKGIPFYSYKDQVIFEKDEILKKDGKPYTVYTYFKDQWRNRITDLHLESYTTGKYFNNFFKSPPHPVPSLSALGFRKCGLPFPTRQVRTQLIKEYDRKRDLPAIPGTSRIGVHLRFGTVSIRNLVRRALPLNEVWLQQLIWREFFIMILYHFPHVVTRSFKPVYDNIPWRNRKEEFERWKNGQTGYPLVDAGMRELNATGFMHNRVRMVSASFLTKHLLIDWRWGEAYFAKKLLDYELAANNGNWQWVAGCGCDAAPYFRVFNPGLQLKKFDPDLRYVNKWVPELDSSAYPKPMVDHDFARERAISIYRKVLSKK